MNLPRTPPRTPLFTVPGNHPGLLKPGNLNLNARPTVHNPDGSISTVRSISVTDDKGRAFLIPTVVGNRVVSKTKAINHFQQTGENLGMFKTWQQADAYAQLLHAQQAQAYR